ncbi:MAG: DUF1549 and DUF1553 domain-containing protein [Pirellulales bacterium]
MNRLVRTLVTSVCLMIVAEFARPDESSFESYEREHWSLVPRSRPQTPTLTTAPEQSWARTAVDTFVLERIRAKQLSPSPVAPRNFLIRRLYYDLWGLPPDVETIAEFERNESPDAVEQLVDRLLASPRYGERQAQHWLDVVRFAETEGFEYDQHRPGAWRFRDYVIDSLNRDKPFDQFAREQLAGDELAHSNTETRVAAGFHRLGPVRRNAGNTDVAFSRNEVLTEMTDAVGVVFLGLTVGCARCHDHKFDPIRQVDYYRLQAYLASTDEHDISVAPPDEARRWNDETNRVKQAMKVIREKMQNAEGRERDALVAQLKKLELELPEPLPTLSSVQVLAERKAEVAVLQRGQTDKPLQTVRARPLGVLVADDRPEESSEAARPKSQLADWLLDPTHPLTARVYVNRQWQWRFGQGLVATPNDFGLNGAAPTHPALLDWLANQLIANQWQTKPLHRLLVTSAVYRQASDEASESSQRDPENRWLARFTRRRLDAEQIRDSLLSVSGQMDLRLGGESIMTPVDADLVKLLYKPTQWTVAPQLADHHRRTIYLIAKRNLRLPQLEVFDQPDLAISCARRESSTHAPQALELLNGPFSNRLAADFAARIEREAGPSAAQRVDFAFRSIAARPANAEELALCVEFLRDHSPSEFALALFNLTAFMYVE